METLFDEEEAEKYLRSSTSTLYRYRKSGKLSYRKIGDRILYTGSDLTAFLEACAVPATAIPTDREKLEIAKAVGGKI